ncbi:hypothetical protein [Jiangella rhizosphaerae]|nr:hypothetical protein [Jiangella rhizosphaerae]
MVTTPRTVLRDVLAVLLAAGLVVLAAAMITGGADTVRGQGPAIHPAAEITPNSLPRADDDPPAADDAVRHAHGDGDAPDGGHAGPDSAVVVTDTTPAGVLSAGTDQIDDTSARPAASAPAGAVDGRAPPEPGDL